MKTATAVLSALALTHQATAVVDKWTPADFNWDAHTQSRFGVATQNVTANPPTKDLVIHANVVQNTNESDLIIHENFPIAITLGATLRAVSWLASAASLASTAVGCWEYLTAEAKEEETTAASRSSCVLGLASSVLGFGGKLLYYSVVHDRQCHGESTFSVDLKSRQSRSSLVLRMLCWWLSKA